MPHRRRVQRGSFGSHFDDLVKHFPDQPAGDEENARSKNARNGRDRLFESAWRKSQEKDRPA